MYYDQRMLTLIDHLGRKAKFKSIEKAVEVTGLTRKNIQHLVQGRHFSYGGWKSPHKNKRKLLKSWENNNSYVNTVTREMIISANSEGTKEIRNLTKQLHYGRRLFVKNWVLKDTYDFLYAEGDYSKVTVISPNGVYTCDPKELKKKCYIV